MEGRLSLLLQQKTQRIGMNEKVKLVLVVIIALAAAGGWWYTKRTVNYALNYRGQVEDTIKLETKGLMDKITELEKRVKLLETKGGK